MQLMMESQPFIICSLNNSYYGIEALAVQEIFFLPELTLVAEAPHDIVGMLNLRGEILPVIDLHLRLGQQSQEYQPSDSVVVLNWEEFQIGVIVNQVHEVQNISRSDIKTNQFYGRDERKRNGSRPPLYPQGTAKSAHFVFGVAQVGENLVMLLNHQNLLQYTPSVKEETTDAQQADNSNVTPFNKSDRNADINGDGDADINGDRNADINGDRNADINGDRNADINGDRNADINGDGDADINGDGDADAKSDRNLVFCPNATPEERAIFRERAENLRRIAESEDVIGLIPLAVIGLNGEYFGLELDAVREFTDIGKITPIPCCPPHIIGNINLRGEIVTLIDIRGLLNLPLAGARSLSLAMVVRIDDLVAGVTVDNVFDVMYLNPSQIMPIPAAVHSMNDEYLRGTAPYRENMMSILELSKILTKGGLTVDDEV